MRLSAVRSIVAIVCAASMWACQDEPAAPVATPGPYDSVPARVLALGDSYTVGESVAPAKSWPFQLADSLLADRVQIEGPTIVARTGWTTTHLLDAAADLDGGFQLVALQIGVNNQFGGAAFGVFEREFPALVERAIALALGSPRRVVVLSLPDYSVTPYGQRVDTDGTIAAEIDAYNAFARSVAEARGTTFVDVTDLSRRALDEPDLVARDGLHFSAEMYALWVARLRPMARDVLLVRLGASSW